MCNCKYVADHDVVLARGHKTQQPSHIKLKRELMKISSLTLIEKIQDSRFSDKYVILSIIVSWLID